MREKRRAAASLAAAVVMAFAGAGTAHAAKQPGAAHGTTGRGSVAGGGCQQGHDCPKPPPVPVPTGCFDIDSTVQDPDKYVSVVCNGRVYVLTVRETPPTNPQPVGGWRFVGGPTNVIDATLASRSNQVYVTVLTANGTVYEGVCTATEPLTVPCTFTQLPTPP